MRRTNVAAYDVRVQTTRTGLLATVQDLPGCVAAGRDDEELQVAVEQAIVLYLDEHPDAPAHYGGRIRRASVAHGVMRGWTRARSS